MANYEDNRIIASQLDYAYPDADKNAVENVTMRVKKGALVYFMFKPPAKALFVHRVAEKTDKPDEGGNEDA